MTPTKTAVIGAAGQLGRVLFEASRRAFPDAIGTDWKGRDGLARLDLLSPDISGLRLAETGHRWAVIAAIASKRFDVCEKDPAGTRKANVDGTLELARRLARSGVKVAYVSTDGVFDGERGGYTEQDTPAPVNEYGRQKRDAEAGLPEATGGRCLILRVGQLFGDRKGDGTLPDQIASRLSASQRVDAAWDQRFAPTLLSDLPRTLAALQGADASGIVHAAGPEVWTRLGVAERLAEGLGAPKTLVRRISLDDVGGGFKRPKDLSLKCERLRSEFGLTLTPASLCMDRVIANYRAVGGRTE